jgi:sec-independent protein translocase protein TatB
MLGVVTLLVVGPEQLPKVARTAGLWFGRARRMIASVKADIERELRAEEMKEFLHKQSLSAPLEEIIEDSREAMQEIRTALDVSKDVSELDTHTTTKITPNIDAKPTTIPRSDTTGSP